MEPSDVVQISITREEAARMHAALAALCSLQQMMPGSPKAMRLTDAVEVIEGVLPRLREHFPEEAAETSESLGLFASDTKSYEPPTFEQVPEFDVRVADLENLTREQAAAVFSSEYDDAIRALMGTLNAYTDWSAEDFDTLLSFLKDLMSATVPVPSNLTVSQSAPYVAVSDLLTLGKLAHEMYKRQDQIDDNISKPF